MQKLLNITLETRNQFIPIPPSFQEPFKNALYHGGAKKKSYRHIIALIVLEA